jgi:hypothetical protein
MRGGVAAVLRYVLLYALSVMCGAVALGTWAEVLNLGGDPEGGGVGLAVVGTVCGALAVALLLLAERIRGR